MPTPQHFLLVRIQKTQGMHQKNILKNVNKIDNQMCSYFSNFCSLSRGTV